MSDVEFAVVPSVSSFAAKSRFYRFLWTGTSGDITAKTTSEEGGFERSFCIHARRGSFLSLCHIFQIEYGNRSGHAGLNRVDDRKTDLALQKRPLSTHAGAAKDNGIGSILFSQ
nr:hypothetical protein [Marinicella sp. W31]MDC2877292.1 hypothetical protein [Marinicella sp. W31]